MKFLALHLVLTVLLSVPVMSGTVDKTPMLGELAQDFELKSLDGSPVKLSVFTEKGPVAIVVLSGYPGGQSSICKRQVADLFTKASAFQDAGARVILIYPGIGEGLQEHAKEFLGDKMLPHHFDLALDPDFIFSNKFGLRWEVKNETVYPATFVVNAKGMITFAKVSKTHGGRPTTEEIFKALSIK